MAHTLNLVKDADGHVRPACGCGWTGLVGVIPTHPAANAALLSYWQTHVERST